MTEMQKSGVAVETNTNDSSSPDEKLNEMNKWSTKGGLLPILYMPLVLLSAIYYQCSYASNANIDINRITGRYIWYAVTLLLSIDPTRLLVKQLVKKRKRIGEGQRVTNHSKIEMVGKCFLATVFLSSHVVTAVAFIQKEITADKLMLLFVYDLILFGTFVYWKQAHDQFSKGVQLLALLLWLSALYGIAEHFWFSEISHLYNDVSEGQRVISVFVNTIPASSIWLMGLWLPFPGNKLWLKILAKASFVLAIFFTGTKNAWLGLAFSALLFMGLHWREISLLLKRLSVLQKAVVALSVIAGCITVYHIGEYGMTIMSRWDDVQTQGSFLARLQHIQDTVNYMLNDIGLLRRLFGMGYATSWKFVENSPHYYGVTLRCIDNQYFTSLFEFGLLSVIAIIILIRDILSRLRERDQVVRGSAFGLSAMLIPLIAYDPFRWQLVMAMFLPLCVVILSGEWRTVSRSRFAGVCITTVAGVATGVFVIPPVVRGLRTISQIIHNKYHIALPERFIEIILWISCAIGLFILLVLLYQMICGIVQGVFPRTKCLAFATGAGLLATGFGLGTVLINRAETKYSSILDSEEEAMHAVVSGNTGTVYVDEYPSLYKLRFGGINASVFSGDDVIRADATTIIVDRELESADLFRIGFRYTVISDQHGLYTDDPIVIQQLQSKGFHLTGYYSAAHTAFTQDAAVIENTDADYPESAVQEADLLNHLELSSGKKYTISMEGHISADVQSQAASSEDVIPLWICVVDEGTGRKMYEKKSAFRDIIQEDITFTAPSGINGSGKVCLQLRGTGILSANDWYFEYRQTPDYDVHYICDYADHCIREEYFDLEGNRVMNQDGFHSVDYEYNRRIDPVRKTYCDITGKPVRTKTGYVVIKSTFKEHRLIREEYYNGKGKRLYLPGGQAIEEYEYDDRGNLIGRKYFNKKKEAVCISSGYAQIKYEYNELNQIVQEMYYDNEGKPKTISGGYAGIIYDKNASGYITGMTYIDENGQPVLNTTGYSRVCRDYNDRNMAICESFYDKEGVPVNSVAGYAQEKREYDEIGNLIERSYYDPDGNAVITTSGYAVIRYAYDENRYSVREHYYDTEGHTTMVPGGKSEYEYQRDDNGYVTAYRFLDENGNLIMSTYGYAQICRKYNRYGAVIEEQYLDTEGRPVPNSAGYALVKRKYNTRRQIVEEVYYDEQGNAFTLSEGYSRLQYTYSKDNAWDIVQYCNDEGRLMTINSGYAQIRRTYNERNQRVCEEYLDLDGKLTLTTSGFAMRKMEYDLFGRISGLRCFDTEGDPVMTSGGWSWQTRNYNFRNQETNETYYDVEGNRVELPQGYSAIGWVRNETGYPVEEYYFGVDDEPVSRVDGIARIVREYDASGQLKSERHFDLEGRLLED